MKYVLKDKEVCAATAWACDLGPPHFHGSALGARSTRPPATHCVPGTEMQTLIFADQQSHMSPQSLSVRLDRLIETDDAFIRCKWAK